MLHPSPEEKVSSWINVAFDIVSTGALILAIIIFMLLAAGTVVLLMTPELSVPPFEVVK